MERQFAAGGVVIKKDMETLRVLLIEDSYGHWTWAKGHIEDGESPEQTAVREVSEETGLADLQILEKLGKQERLEQQEPWVIQEQLELQEQQDLQEIQEQLEPPELQDQQDLLEIQDQQE